MVLNIGLDALLLDARAAGIGQYIRALAEAYVQKFGEVDQVWALLQPGEHVVGVREFHETVSGRSSLRRLMFEQWTLPSQVRRQSYDVFHFPDYQVPIWRPLPRVVMTVHDLAAFRFPAVFSRSQGALKRYLMRKSVERADAIIVPSRATRQDLMELLGVPDDRIFVVPHGVRFSTLPDTGQSPRRRPFFLAVGTVEPRKNWDRLIQAYKLLVDRHQDVPDLLIAGKIGWMAQDTVKLPRQLGLQDMVQFLEYVPNDELAVLYQEAVAVTYPSLYEGFGLPVIEAMGYGVPVVTSGRGALREIAEGVAIMVDPDDVESITDGLQQALAGREALAPMVHRASARAHEYTWERTAELTRVVYQTVKG